MTELKQKAAKIVDYTKSEIAGIRSGRASPSLVENLIVDTYEGQTRLKLKELASITTEGPAGLIISPFDPLIVKDVEKAILTSSLNLTPRVDGKNIHLKIPSLSQEQRRQLVKVISSKIEEGKIKLRNERDEARKKIKLAFEKKELAEDDKFRTEKEIDKIIQEYNKQLEEMKLKKEKEIMEI